MQKSLNCVDFTSKNANKGVKNAIITNFKPLITYSELMFALTMLSLQCKSKTTSFHA